MFVVYAAMSLRDFIRETAKDIQEAATKKMALVEQPLSQRTAPRAGRTKTNAEEEEEEAEEAVPALIR